MDAFCLAVHIWDHTFASLECPMFRPIIIDLNAALGHLNAVLAAAGRLRPNVATTINARSPAVQLR